MRIAVSGAHWCGKSTLVADLAAKLKRYSVIDEPYALLEEDGYEFAHPPSVEDYVAQLECALERIAEPAADVIFDRSPVDFLAYLAAVDDAYDTEEWIEPIREAVRTLDLVIFVPIESPDRIRVPKSEDRALRADVDRRLRALLEDGALELDCEILTVHGSIADRVEHVVRRIEALSL